MKIMNISNLLKKIHFKKFNSFELIRYDNFNLIFIIISGDLYPEYYY